MFGISMAKVVHFFPENDNKWMKLSSESGQIFWKILRTCELHFDDVAATWSRSVPQHRITNSDEGTFLPFLGQVNLFHFAIFDILNHEKGFLPTKGIDWLGKLSMNEITLLGTESINNPVRKINGLEHFSLQYFFSGVLLCCKLREGFIDWDTRKETSISS